MVHWIDTSHSYICQSEAKEMNEMIAEIRGLSYWSSIHVSEPSLELIVVLRIYPLFRLIDFIMGKLFLQIQSSHHDANDR